MVKRLLILLLLAGASYQSMAQGCAICTRTAANLDSKSTRGLNGGILYLAFLPLTMIGTIGFIWWRSNRHAE